MSNSGKPFFVFWSLLAVPTLTILVSDLGDTVVKAVKDVTIWLGEVTVLPSDEDTTRNRLKHGLYKATLGKLDSHHSYSRDVEEGSNNDDDGEKELHPGLARIFKLGRHGGRRHKKGTQETGERLAADFERSEELDESIARKHGERSEEGKSTPPHVLLLMLMRADEHHYRRALLSQIRKVYADATAATPKKYSYAEWARFLSLLGEDEHDPSHHKRALDQEHGPSAQEGSKESGQEAAYSRGGRIGTEEKKKWSWIGNRSPLMGDKEEAEWLLEKLFQRLEDSFHGEGKEKEEGVKKETRKNHRGEQSQVETGFGTGTETDSRSEDTMTSRRSRVAQEERSRREPPEC